MLIIVLGILIFLVLAIILFAYKQSDRILIRKSKYSPITIFPSQYNVPFKEENFKNEEGLSLKGWFIEASSPSDKTIIFLHGWGQNKGDLLPNTIFLREKGFNLFYFDFRGSGESSQGVSSIGYFETKDALNALDYLCQKYPKETKYIGIYGLSMGAAVAIYCAAHRKEIQCVVAEACYFSYEKVVARWAKHHRKVPYFPLVALTLFFVRKRLGIDPEDFSPKKNIKRIGKKPIFIITGMKDSLAPRYDARNLFLNTQHPKKLWLVAGAGHTECAQMAGPEYNQRLEDFFTENLGPQKEL